MTSTPINPLNISQCSTKDRKHQTVAADFDGTLLVGRSSFPYFALIAFDVGGPFRLFLLVLAAPFAGILYYLVSESAGIRVLIFATFAGVHVSDIKLAAKAVLPKHYSEDIHPDTWHVFSSCGRKYVITANPRIMVEPFLKDYLDVDMVLGTEISSFMGVATGFVAGNGVLVGKHKAVALQKAVGSGSMPDIGIGDRESDFQFMKLCKESYMVPPSVKVHPLNPRSLPKPVIFHDGRLALKPTPMMALTILLWLPIGILLSIIRMTIFSLSPISITRDVMQLLGFKITVKGNPNESFKDQTRGVAFVCNHRTVMDTNMVSFAFRRMSTTVSYSVAPFVVWLSPTKSTKLTRDRAKDTMLIKDILDRGECLVLCPEGTTCREPYLLRFSSLFAELTDEIVPVAINVGTSMFYGTSARGHKWLDPFFQMMNLNPTYEVTFLDKLPYDQTCRGGKSCHDVANHVQALIGDALNFKCTCLRRKDKYQVLAGNDGYVAESGNVKGG